MNDYHVDNRQIAAWESEESGQQFPLLDYLQLLWFRKKMILALTVFVAVVGYIQISEIKNVYSATSTMLVGMPAERVVDIEEVLRPSTARTDAREEVAVLQSRELAARVVQTDRRSINWPCIRSRTCNRSCRDAHPSR